MSIKGKIYDLRRTWFGRYEVDDPRPTAKSAPYTFYLPPKARLDAVEAGDLVKLIIRSVPDGRKFGAERIWVQVCSISPEGWVGVLDNEPFDIPQLKLGDQIHFNRWHIIDTLWKDPDKEKTLPKEPEQQVWERCLVDQEVLDGTAKVGFLYKEEPDMTEKDDKYPDSGWRIRADVSQLSDEQCENPSPKYVAIGAVLNQDDSWLHLLDAPIGSRFLRNSETGEYEETDD